MFCRKSSPINEWIGTIQLCTTAVIAFFPHPFLKPWPTNLFTKMNPYPPNTSHAKRRSNREAANLLGLSERGAPGSQNIPTGSTTIGQVVPQSKLSWIIIPQQDKRYAHSLAVSPIWWPPDLLGLQFSFFLANMVKEEPGNSSSQTSGRNLMGESYLNRNINMYVHRQLPSPGNLQVCRYCSSHSPQTTWSKRNLGILVPETSGKNWMGGKAALTKRWRVDLHIPMPFPPSGDLQIWWASNSHHPQPAGWKKNLGILVPKTSGGNLMGESCLNKKNHQS